MHRPSLAFGAACVMMLAGCGADDTPQVQSVKPNIVMIMARDIGWSDYGFMGNKVVRTPNLDRLAETGAVFTLAHATSNQAARSRITLMTGQYPDALDGSDRASDIAASGYDTLPQILGEHGYITLVGDDDAIETEAGEVSTKIADFVERGAAEPFFVFYAPPSPHDGLRNSAQGLSDYDGFRLTESAQRYYAGITRLDAAVGGIIETLEETGELDNTLFVYSSGNGWQQPPRADYAGDEARSELGGRQGKLSLFEAAFRTPIIFSWPGMVPIIENDYALVSTVDIIPTALALAGIPSPRGLPGGDLIPIMEGRAASARTHLVGQAHVHRADSTFRGDRVEGEARDLVRPQDAFYARNHDWYYVWLPSTDEHALYDLTRDPRALANLADERPETVTELRGAIEAWLPDSASSD